LSRKNILIIQDKKIIFNPALFLAKTHLLSP